MGLMFSGDTALLYGDLNGFQRRPLEPIIIRKITCTRTLDDHLEEWYQECQSPHVRSGNGPSREQAQKLGENILKST